MPFTAPVMWFQSTHPRGVRRLMPRPALSFGGFNPRTRVGCDYCMPKVTFVMALFQSTHPRGVRRALSGRGSILPVSIHAPAWGATSLSCNIPPRRGGFQSTHPRGVRQQHGDAARDGFVVSIHAPAWGATALVRRMSVRALCFNPRTRVGCDTSRRNRPAPRKQFQSTHPRGVRLLHAEGHIRDGPVSIHAPAWGATQCFDFFLCCFPVSIHAPAWGATGFRERVQDAQGVSIHAPAWGATGDAARPAGGNVTFQSTHPRGVRQDRHRRHGLHGGFNPRTRVGCDIPSRSFIWQLLMFQSTHPRGVRQEVLYWNIFTTSFNPRTRVGCDCFHVLSSRFP